MKITDEGFWSIAVSILVGCFLIITVMGTLFIVTDIYHGIVERDTHYCECLEPGLGD